MKLHLATEKCTGCTACYASCRHAAIKMIPDNLGFFRPMINEKLCIGCGSCENACPVLQKTQRPHWPIKCFAAKTQDKALLIKSSSGGIFSELAQQVLAANGVVFGCVLDKSLKATHVRAATIDQIEPMRGSKYVQSDLKNTYAEALQDLYNGKKVLFTGTPCQIQGLKSFLHKPYDNLITVGLICHGAPAPQMFEHYKHSEELRIGETLKSFEFRSKHYSWQEFAISLGFHNAAKNEFISQWSGSYMCIFSRNYMMRESCFHCPARTGRSQCDLLIGDYWGIEREHPQLDSTLGFSCALAYTEKGLQLIKSLPIERIETTYSQIKRGNANIENNPTRPFGIEYFRSHFNQRPFDYWPKWVFWGPWWLRPFCPIMHWQEFKSTWVKACYHKFRDLIHLP